MERFIRYNLNDVVCACYEPIAYWMKISLSSPQSDERKTIPENT